MLNFKPRIYSLLVCSQVGRDAITGGWQLNPISHLAVERLPVHVDLVLVANVMAPPGPYRLMFGLRHDDESAATLLAKPADVEVMPDKNLEFMARIGITLSASGLYLFEASLDTLDTLDRAISPIRISIRR